MTPFKIDTTDSDIFVQYSTRFTPFKGLNVYGPTLSWDRYVDSQPSWIKSLLQNIHFFTDNREVIWNNLQTFGYLLIVFDGSVRYISSILFGWILANPDGRWLEAAISPSMGQGSYLHAEGDGMLSGVLFLFIIADGYPSEQCTITYISNNFGLIQQNTKYLDYDTPYPNTTL